MKNMIKEFVMKNKYVIIAIFLLVSILIGGTYAWINIELFGSKTNRVSAGTLSIELDESTCENITTTNAYPVSDEEGLKQVACTFSVENTGSLDSVYSVFLDDIELESGEIRMPDSSIKYALKRNDNNPFIQTLDTTITDAERLLDSRRIKVGESNTYELRFWIKEDAGVEAMNKVFYTNLRVVANLDTPKPVIETVNDYYTYSSGTVSLSSNFESAVNGNTSFTDSKGNVWNPSDPLPNPGRTYNDSEGNAKDVTSMSNMFVYNSANNLDLGLWDTSNVTDMSSMFRDCSAITLDLSVFDTSNVTDMSNMFYQSDSTVIDVSNFITSKVTDMSNMFSDSAASVLDVSDFDTSNVTSMSNMFSNSTATSLDVSGFDTSNVTNLGRMFRDCPATNLDLSNFDTSNVIYMFQMFYYSDAITLDVSGFDTSNVINMSHMFFRSKATTLDVSGFNTSKVIDMNGMFEFSRATSLDVSGFDISKVTNMSTMFWSSSANPIYVKDQAMLDRFVAEGSATSSRLQIK